MEELIVSRFFSELSKAPKRGNGNFGGGSFSPPSHLPEKLPCCSQQPRNQDGAEEPGDGPNEEAGSQAERLPGLSPQSSASGPQGSMTPSNARNPACSERRGGTRRALRTRPWWRWGACRVCPPLTHSWGVGCHCPHSCLTWHHKEASHHLFSASGGRSKCIPFRAGPCAVVGVVLIHACLFPLDLWACSGWNVAVQHMCRLLFAIVQALP